jgi:archaellum biogenesis ATPase FlaH
MADMGRSLISKIVQEDDIVTALAAGIQADWFEEPEHHDAYAWMVDYFSKYSETPTADALKQQYPTYRLLKVPEPYDWYVDHFRTQRTRAIILDAIIDANTAIQDDDTVKAQNELAKGLTRLGMEVSSLSDEDAVGDLKARYKQYKLLSKGVGNLTGIPTGFATLNRVSGGWHDSGLVVIGGSAKQGKSWMLICMAIAAQDYGKKVLFISFEMSVQEQLARYDGMVSGVNSMKVLHNDLSRDDFKKLRYGMQQREGCAPLIISADITATTTVSGLAGKIEQHSPDLVIVDGAYLMQSEGGEVQGSAQAMTAISRGLKRLAQRIDKPVLITTQALPGKMSKGEVTMHSLGWSSAWGQDADLVLGVERVEGTQLVKLRVVAGRNVSPCEIGLAINWEESEIVEADADELESDD